MTPAKAAALKTIHDANRLTYEWRGETYHGLKAVAEAAGTAISNVCWHLSRYGNLDRLGKYQARYSHLPGQCKPCRIGARSWPSINALADEIGQRPRTVSRWMLKGKHDRIAAVLAERERHTERTAA